MIQIKTVIDLSSVRFDKEVNAALADGWELVRRYSDADGFIAELVKETEPETEPASWLITRDPSLPYRCPVCGHKTDLPADQCPSCESFITWEDSEV